MIASFYGSGIGTLTRTLIHDWHDAVDESHHYCMCVHLIHTMDRFSSNWCQM